MTAPNTVGIAWKCPGFYKGPAYPKLAPPKELYFAYKNDGMPWEIYAAVYQEEVLSKLTPEIIRADLLDDTVLLCWERTGNCHRHLVNDWLWQHGIECEEVSFG
jgi:hypothetical protein